MSFLHLISHSTVLICKLQHWSHLSIVKSEKTLRIRRTTMVRKGHEKCQNILTKAETAYEKVAQLYSIKGTSPWTSSTEFFLSPVNQLLNCFSFSTVPSSAVCSLMSSASSSCVKFQISSVWLQVSSLQELIAYLNRVTNHSSIIHHLWKRCMNAEE